jgi:hypothetical protein
MALFNAWSSSEGSLEGTGDVSSTRESPLRFVRKNERREVRRAISMTCQIVRERDFRLVSERAVDLSPDGMLVATDVDLEVGENVFVSFRATELGLWFDSEALVARTIRGRRPGDKGKGIALRFSTMPRVKRFILRGHLRRIPPPIPRRAQRIDWSATIRSIES